MGVFLAREIKQGPRPPGKDHPVHVDIILDDILKLVVRLVERPAHQGGKGLLRCRHVLAPSRLSQSFGFRPARGYGGRIDHMKRFVGLQPPIC